MKEIEISCIFNAMNYFIIGLMICGTSFAQDSTCIAIKEDGNSCEIQVDMTKGKMCSNHINQVLKMENDTTWISPITNICGAPVENNKTCKNLTDHQSRKCYNHRN